jgi:N-carbamoyl-L-amino-acid hydrolase
MTIDLIRYRGLAEKIFADVREFSFDGVGITRESYGRGESAAADYLRDFAESEGLTVQADRAANLIVRFPETPVGDPVVWMGSHMDSVPQGGNYDGLAGVVAGLLCLVARRREGVGGPFEVIGLRGEESAWFGKAYVGSSALLGILSEADLALRRRGAEESLGDCMRGLGADMTAIRAGERLFDLAHVKAYLELHIEQGPVMVARNLPVAVVSSIRGNFRHNHVVCEGEAGHSGVVPRWLRHDAMFAVADLLMRLDEHWRMLLERGTDLVLTAGIVGTDPADHAVSRIPGRVAFSLEARSRSTDTLEAFYQLVRAECSAIAHERGVAFEFDRRVLSAPATMNVRVCDTLSAACAALELAHDVIPSGAGHDAALMANAGIPSGMVFVRNQNGSHNPREAMELDDFMQGVQVLSNALEPLCA